MSTLLAFLLFLAYPFALFPYLFSCSLTLSLFVCSIAYRHVSVLLFHQFSVLFSYCLRLLLFSCVSLGPIFPSCMPWAPFLHVRAARRLIESHTFASE